MPPNNASVEEGFEANGNAAGEFESHCFVAGWGLTDSSDPTSAATKLMEVEVAILDMAECNGNMAYNGTLGNENFTMICAGSMEGGIDSCQGDSGGPLICLNGNNEAVVQGIVSWGEGCAEPNKPGIYAAVGNVTEWIKFVTGVNEASPGVNHVEHYASSDANHVNHTSKWDSNEYPGCGDEIVSYGDGTDVISAPLAEGVYLNGLQCTWTIRVPEGSIVQLNITLLDIEEDDEW